MEKGALSRLQTGFSTGQLVFYLKQLMYMIFHNYRTLTIRVCCHSFSFLKQIDVNRYALLLTVFDIMILSNYCSSLSTFF